MNKINEVMALRVAKKVRLYFLKQPLCTQLQITLFAKSELLKHGSEFSLPLNSLPDKEDCRTNKGIHAWIMMNATLRIIRRSLIPK